MDSKRSYGQIIKSSTLIGGSSALSMVFRIVRTKVLALLLGPSGFGMVGMYMIIADLAHNVAGMGINSSGVRQIAEAVGTGDPERIARTVATLRRTAFCTATIGALVLLVLCEPISWLTFHDYRYAGPVALLALVVFFSDISSAQSALVQGMRRIGDLARMNLLGAFYGSLFSIAVVYYFFQRGQADLGVVPSMVCVAAMSILTSWWYARRIKVDQVRVSLRDSFREASSLLNLGFVFSAVALMATGAAYVIRLILSHHLGMREAGFYHSAWSLGGLCAGIILQAMWTDFYPRLTAVAKDNAECNRLVNEQTEAGLLMASPAVIGTLAFGPLVIMLFYSTEFEPAVGVFRWICLGMLLRVFSWPISVILPAKGAARLFLWSEVISHAVYVALTWAGILTFGLEGAGIAFVATEGLYLVGIYLVARWMTGFRWSVANRQLALLFLPSTAATFAIWYALPNLASLMVGFVLTLSTGIYSTRTLCALLPWERIPRQAQKLMLLFRFVPRNEGI